MYKVRGQRGTGKTTKLLEYAAKHGYVLVEPTERSVKCIVDMAKKNGIDNVRVISLFDYIKQVYYGTKQQRFLIDEVDYCLSLLDVVGYSGPVEMPQSYIVEDRV